MATQNILHEYLGTATDSSYELAALVERGLPTDSLSALREKGLTFTEMASVIPHRTLKHRKARGENLTAEETDRALRIASVIALADKVFANHDKAMRWLRGVDDQLENRTPLSMLHTEAGGRLVEGMLRGIDEGIFS